MYSMLGSQFETSLRLLLLLEAVCNESLTEDTIAALDFITLYSHDFDVTEICTVTASTDLESFLHVVKRQSSQSNNSFWIG
jgi:hypothetical protein